MQFTVNPSLLTAFVLALARASAYFMVAPPFAARSIPMKVRAGLAAALALYTAANLPAETIPLDAAGFIGALVTQVLVGFGLGFVCYLLLSAITSAGGIIDNMAGFTLSQYYDPQMGDSTAVFSRYYYQVGLTLLIVSNAHLVLLDGFMRSFTAIPANAFDLGKFNDYLVHNMGQLLVSALEISAPVAAVLFLTEVGMGLLARAAPSLNVFQLAFPIRIVVTLAASALALPLLVPALENLVADAARAMSGGG